MSDYYPKCPPDVACPHCNPRPARMSESSFAAPTGLERITDEEMCRAVSGKAAIAEHDANAAQRCGLHGEQLESMKRHAATLRAAANKLRSNS